MLCGGTRRHAIGSKALKRSRQKRMQMNEMAERHRNAQKPHVIQISSSSEQDSSDEDRIVENIVTSSSEDELDNDSEWIESDEEGSSGGEDDVDELDDEESMCDREKRDLHYMSIKECKAYLREHGLRLSGTKEECIRRIEEHYRLRDGDGETRYPRSSFTIDCTWDVCRGDVVLFTQKVYDNFNKVTRRGSIIGKRIIAGRIVKESYGAGKQQHTFTVEVLWSKGGEDDTLTSSFACEGTEPI